MSRIATAALLASIVVFAPSRVNAQFSIKAGASFGSTSESEFVPDVSNQTGFAAGIAYGLKMGGDVFALHIEALNTPTVTRGEEVRPGPCDRAGIAALEALIDLALPETA